MLLALLSERLVRFWRVNSVKAYLVLGVSGIKDGDRIAIGDTYHTASKHRAETCADAHERRQKIYQM